MAERRPVAQRNADVSLQNAMRLRPDWPDALEVAAWLLATDLVLGGVAVLLFPLLIGINVFVFVVLQGMGSNDRFTM
jgi:hypothetical protein